MAESKVCTKCGEEKLLEEFGKRKQSKDGRDWRCKECVRTYNTAYALSNKEKLAQYKKDWVEENKDYCKSKSKANYDKNKVEILKKQKVYRGKNTDKMAAYGKAYYKNNKADLAASQKDYVARNKDKVAAYHAEYYKGYRDKAIENSRKHYKENRDEALSKQKLYREANEKEIAAKRLEAYHSPSKSEYLLSKIPMVDSPKMVDGLVTVVCKTCGKRFAPTYSSIDGRRRAIESTGGESSFYCSDSCKAACPTFNFYPHQSIDPRSKLYVPKTEQEEARACQTDHLKQLQRDEFGYNYCEACGQEVDIVDLHHTLEIAKHGTDAINSAGHILLCKECHKKLTRVC